jgi:crotonobetainyl-CoA:carnitine CoA-transferase CaiB-like acyl-CoA transferase
MSQNHSQSDPASERREPDDASDLIVVDLGVGMPAAVASRLLADMGAEVFRIDCYPEPLTDAMAAWRRDNRMLDVEQLERMLAIADVCIVGGEDHPDHLPRWKASDIARRNPRLVVLELTGYGASDPVMEHRAIDLLVQARSGLVWEQSSSRPRSLGYPLPTYGMVLQGVLGVWCALFERLSSGQGQIVTTSLLQGGAMYWCQIWLQADKTSIGFDRMAPRDVRQLIFGCLDGSYIQFAMGVPGSLKKLYTTLGIPLEVDEADRGVPDPRRGADYFGDTSLIAQHVAKFERQSLLKALWKVGFAAEAVLGPGAGWDDAQTRALGIIAEEEGLGRFVGTPIRSLAHSAAADGAVKSGLPVPKGGGGPLQGVRILDFGAVIAGPYASALLADLGADVIKVEPLAGDFNRKQVRTTVVANRRKRSIAIDAKSAEGAALIARICASANAVHHNFRVGVAARLGIDPKTLRGLKDDIVTLETSAYGEVGPKASQPGFDSMMQAHCGHEVRAGGRGNPPHCCRTFFIDFTAGGLGAIALAAGLFRQRRQGRGADFATSLLEAGNFLLSELVQRRTGEFVGAPPLNEDQTGFSVFESLYETRDGWIAVALRSDAMASRFVLILELELPRSRDSWAAPERQAIRRALLVRDSGEILDRFKAADVWAEPCVENGWQDFAAAAEMAGHRFVGSVIEPAHGKVTGWVEPLFSLSRTPAAPWRPFSPMLGEHTDEILAELGVVGEKIAELRRRGVIG